MRYRAHRAKTQFRQTGRFTARVRLLGAKRSGALSPAVIALAILAVFALFASDASAAQTRLYTGTSFGPEGSAGAATFASVQGIAVDQSSGNVYVYDAPAEKVYKFDVAITG